jgi:hypothetical protein
MTAARTFEICAFFNHESAGTANGKDGMTVPRPAYPEYYSPENEYWDHSAGHACFTRTIDPEKYPPYLKAPMVR